MEQQQTQQQPNCVRITVPRAPQKGNNWPLLLEVARTTPVGGRFTIFCTRRHQHSHNRASGATEAGHLVRDRQLPFLQLPLYRWVATVVSVSGGGDVYIRLRKGPENDVHGALCRECEERGGCYCAEISDDRDHGCHVPVNTAINKVNSLESFAVWAQGETYCLLTHRQTPPFVDVRAASGSKSDRGLPWGPTGVTLTVVEPKSSHIHPPHPRHSGDKVRQQQRLCVMCCAVIDVEQHAHAKKASSGGTTPAESKTQCNSNSYVYTVQQVRGGDVIDPKGPSSDARKQQDDDVVSTLMRQVEELDEHRAEFANATQLSRRVHSVVTAGLLPLYHNVLPLCLHRRSSRLNEANAKPVAIAMLLQHKYPRNEYYHDPCATQELGVEKTIDNVHCEPKGDQKGNEKIMLGSTAISGLSQHPSRPCFPTLSSVDSSYSHMVSVLRRQYDAQRRYRAAIVHDDFCSAPSPNYYPNIDLAIPSPLQAHDSSSASTLLPSASENEKNASARYLGGHRLGEGTFGHADIYYDTWSQQNDEDAESSCSIDTTQLDALSGGACHQPHHQASDDDTRNDSYGKFLQKYYRQYAWVVGKAVDQPQFLTHGRVKEEETHDAQADTQLHQNYSVHTTVVREMVAMAMGTDETSSTLLSPLLDMQLKPLSQGRCSVEFLMPFVAHDLHKLLYYPPLQRLNSITTNPLPQPPATATPVDRREFIFFDAFKLQDNATRRDNGNTNRTAVPMPDVLRGVLKALCALHAHGRAHRDVKTSNILITASGEVRLADYGWSRLYNYKKKGKRKISSGVGTTTHTREGVLRNRKEYHSHPGHDVLVSDDEETDEDTRTQITPRPAYPPRVTCPPCAINYRPIELLLGGLWKDALIIPDHRGVHQTKMKPMTCMVSKPEQYYDCEQLDMYSFGCLLFETMSGGVRLWQGKTEMEVLMSIATVLGVPRSRERCRINHEVQKRTCNRSTYLFPSVVDDDDSEDLVSDSEGNNYRDSSSSFKANITSSNVASSKLRIVPDCTRTADVATPRNATLGQSRNSSNRFLDQDLEADRQLGSSAILPPRNVLKTDTKVVTHWNSQQSYHQRQPTLRVSYKPLREIHQRELEKYAQQEQHLISESPDERRQPFEFDTKSNHNEGIRHDSDPEGAYSSVPPLLRRRCRQHNILDERVIALLASLLSFDPNRRPSAAKTLRQWETIYGYNSDHQHHRDNKMRKRSRSDAAQNGDQRVPWIALPPFSVHSLPWPPR